MIRAVKQIREHLPSGQSLPKEFNKFVESRPPGKVGWSTLTHFGLSKTAEKELVPFLGLADGSLVAFWYSSCRISIVHLGSHGERAAIIATDFHTFLRNVADGKTGVPDIDEMHNTTRTNRITKRRKPRLEKALQKWISNHTELLAPNREVRLEPLRCKCFAIAREMIRDGKSKVYSLRSPYWSMDYRIRISRGDIELTYLDYGQWYVVPNRYGLGEIVLKLIKEVKHPKRRSFEMSITDEGAVSIDDDRELLLVSKNVRKR